MLRPTVSPNPSPKSPRSPCASRSRLQVQPRSLPRVRDTSGISPVLAPLPLVLPAGATPPRGLSTPLLRPRAAPATHKCPRGPCPRPRAVYVRARTHSSPQPLSGDPAAPGGWRARCAVPKSSGGTLAPAFVPAARAGAGKAGPWAGWSGTHAGLQCSSGQPTALQSRARPSCLPAAPPLPPSSGSEEGAWHLSRQREEALGFGPGHAEEGGERQFPALPCPPGPPGCLPTAVSPGPSFFRARTFLQSSNLGFLFKMRFFRRLL